MLNYIKRVETLGGSEALIKEYQHFIIAGVIVFAMLVGGYICWQKWR